MSPGPIRLALAFAAALALLCGCAPSDTLIFSTYTKVGVDISVANGTPSEAVFGYKRFEGALIPVDARHPPSDGHPQIPPIYASMDLRNGWLSGICVAQVFATGQAATEISHGGADNQPAAPNCKSGSGQ